MYFACRLPLLIVGALLGAWALGPCVCVDDQARAGACGRAGTLVRSANCCGGGGDGRPGDLRGRTGCECTKSRLVARVTPRPDSAQSAPAVTLDIPEPLALCPDTGGAPRADDLTGRVHDPPFSPGCAARAPPSSPVVSA